MDKFYFAAKIQQEYANNICKKAISLGVPEEHILLSRKACNFLQIGIYIKFNNADDYKEFSAWDIPGIIENGKILSPARLIEGAFLL